MDLPFRIRHRLEELGLGQRDLANAAQAAEIQAADPRTTLSQLLQRSSQRRAAAPKRVSARSPAITARATPPIASPEAQVSRRATHHMAGALV